jgi:type II secretion system protein N
VNMNLERLKALAKKWAPRVAFPFFYMFCFFVFVSWTFPYDKLKERIVVTFNAQQRATNGNQELQIDELSSWWVTGVKAKGVHVLTNSTEPDKPPGDLKIEEARARISILGLLIGNKDVSFKLDAFGGKVDGYFDDKGKERAVEVNFEGVDIGQIEPLTQLLGVPMEGKLDGTIKLTMPEGKASKGSGTVTLEVQDVAVGDGKAKIKGTLALPRLSVGTLSLAAEAKDGILKITKFGAGGKDIELSGDGRIQMRELATDSGIDVNVKFKINDGYRQKNDVTKSLFGAPGSNQPALFELADPKVKQSKRPDGFYGWHLRGTLGRPDFAPAPSGAGPSVPGAIPGKGLPQ